MPRTIVRYEYQGQEQVGTLVDGQRVQPVSGDIFGPYEPSGEPLPLAAVRLLPPVTRPSKIVAVALNYRSHLGERPATENPELFLKPPSSIIGPDEAIILPKEAGRVDYEGELVAVIGRRAKHVSSSDALSYVLGYTCGNDVSAREWQRGDTQWWRAKGSDTFAPLGPWIVTDLDPTQLELCTRVNGEERQRSPTSLLIHDVAKVISFASRVMTLEPGDLIYTGTPGTTQPLQPGDVVEVEITNIGVLRNTVKPE